MLCFSYHRSFVSFIKIVYCYFFENIVSLSRGKLNKIIGAARIHNKSRIDCTLAVLLFSSFHFSRPCLKIIIYVPLEVAERMWFYISVFYHPFIYLLLYNLISSASMAVESRTADEAHYTSLLVITIFILDSAVTRRFHVGVGTMFVPVICSIVRVNTLNCTLFIKYKRMKI